jgi:hypothetical protein
VERYDSLATKAALEAIPGFRWCIAKNCKSGQVHGNGDAKVKFCCVGCKKSHCIKHQVTWHKGETCAQYEYRYVTTSFSASSWFKHSTVMEEYVEGMADSNDRTDSKIKKAEESASKKLLNKLAKKCPGCKRNVEKVSGCNHMTCKDPYLSLVMRT